MGGKKTKSMRMLVSGFRNVQQLQPRQAQLSVRLETCQGKPDISGRALRPTYLGLDPSHTRECSPPQCND